MPSPATSAQTNKPISRTRIPLSSAAPVYFVPERDPLLPPIIRATELPMSSQSDSSPVKPPSIPLKPENGPEGSKWKQDQEEEDDFDGIEDVPLSQYIPSVPRSRKKPDLGLTLDDLFSDEGNVEDMISLAESGRKQDKTSQSSAGEFHFFTRKEKVLIQQMRILNHHLKLVYYHHPLYSPLHPRLPNIELINPIHRPLHSFIRLITMAILTLKMIVIPTITTTTITMMR
jgi:hypothetical protein